MKMKTLLKSIILCVIYNTAIGLEPGKEINEESYQKIYKNIAIRFSGPDYKVIIDAITTEFNDHPNTFSEAVRPLKITPDKTLWTITKDQLPLTLDDCYDFHLGSDCEKDTEYCYKNCLMRSSPEVIAYDAKNKKVYLNYPTPDIGTGGGPAILFVADINKREIKRLKLTNWGQLGSISPSTRYLVINGESIISIYDTQTDSWSKMNESENDYSGKRYIVHNLTLKKWLNDNQFVYIDQAHYFTRPVEPTPFINAKEVTYDIPGKTMLSEKKITENEYNEFIKKMNEKLP